MNERIDGMLFTGRLGASALLDMHLLALPKRLEDATQEIIKRVIAEGDQHAYKIAPESVHVQKVREYPATFQVELDAVWSPRSAVLHGGAYDGDLLQVRTEDQRWPLNIIGLPYRSSPLYRDASETGPPFAEYPRYQREGIDPIADAWVYRLIR